MSCDVAAYSEMTTGRDYNVMDECTGHPFTDFRVPAM